MPVRFQYNQKVIRSVGNVDKSPYKQNNNNKRTDIKNPLSYLEEKISYGPGTFKKPIQLISLVEVCVLTLDLEEGIPNKIGV